MPTQLNLILKILVLSAVLSAIIKYGGQFLAITPTSTNALIGIVVIPLVMAVALTWRWLLEKGRRQKAGGIKKDDRITSS